jgi:competence protein ComEC
MKAIGARHLLPFLAGATALWFAPTLPPAWLAFALLPVAALVAWRLPRLRIAACFMLGAAWVAGFAAQAMEKRLHPALAGTDLVIDGRVLGLPQKSGMAWRFDFLVEHSEHLARISHNPPTADGCEKCGLAPGSRLRLSWFGAEAEPMSGSRWRIGARLRPPRGSVNPGGFDFERYALERGVVATGSVRTAHRLSMTPDPTGIDGLRDRHAAHIADLAPGTGGALLRALAVGDRRGLEDAHWDVLRATGTSHLMAISGLHVGLVAALGVLLGRALVWLWPALSLRMPARFWALLPALPLAVGYAAMAGFAVPTRRALLMLLVAALALLLRRHARATHVLLLAACSVLLLDPLAVFGASFWLSVLGVAALILFARGQVRGGHLGRLVQAQGVLSLALLPFTLLFFGMLSVAGPIANLLAVPWVGLVSVPLGLLGTGLGMLWPGLGDPLLRAAATTLEWIWWTLERLASPAWAMTHLSEPSPVAWLLAALGILVLLLPRGVPGRPLGLLLLLPLLVPADNAPAHGAVRIVLFDVGQGTSLLVQTRAHSLLYDAGPSYPGGLDLGEAAVLPALRALGVRRLDAIVISHADRDHAGGLGAIRRAFPDARLLASGVADAGPCLSGEHWQWDGMDFAILYPPRFLPYLGNDSSCVLAIRGNGGGVLLTGDIGALVERRLVREQVREIRADILLAPHHGSRSSSSAGFIDAVEPRLALVSAGWMSRFGHPAPEVVARYRERGVALASTAECGAWIIDLRHDGAIETLAARAAPRRFWRHACTIGSADRSGGME